jgi:hypothetical protein
MGKSIYISDKQFEAIQVAADAIRTNCESASDEYVKEHYPIYKELEKIERKWLRARKA